MMRDYDPTVDSLTLDLVDFGQYRPVDQHGRPGGTSGHLTTFAGHIPD